MGGKALSLAVAASALAAALGAATAAPGATPGGSAGAPPKLDQAIVEVATPQHRARSGRILDRIAERNDLAVRSRIPETGQLTVSLGSEPVSALRDALAGDPRVLSVTADRIVEQRYAPNDFAFSRADSHAPFGDLYQWNLVRSFAPPAWDRSKGSGAEVAVIDSGAYTAHPDLAGRITGTLDCDPTPCGAGSVADPDGHGTHVAGLACADSDNGYGLASIGFDCGLYVIRVVTCSAVGAALVAAANRGSDAINMSVGGCPDFISDEVDFAWSSGSVPVAAGTNTQVPGGNNYPAAQVQPDGTGPNMSSGEGLVVTAAKHDGNRATIAQLTSGVSVAAYGFATDVVGGQQGILSTWPSATTTIENGTPFGMPPTGPCNCRTVLNGDNDYAYLVGTSMATPQVAGLVALMRAAVPSLSAPKLVRLVKASSSNCGQYGAGGLGWGIINADRAVAAAQDRDVDPPSSKLRKGGRGVLRIKSSDTSCSTELPKAGIKTVRIFSSRNGKRFRRIGKTSKSSFRFKPKRKGRYRLYSIAVDRDGNEEAKPSNPDSKVRVKRV